MVRGAVVAWTVLESPVPVPALLVPVLLVPVGALLLVLLVRVWLVSELLVLVPKYERVVVFKHERGSRTYCYPRRARRLAAPCTMVQEMRVRASIAGCVGYKSVGYNMMEHNIHKVI